MAYNPSSTAFINTFYAVHANGEPWFLSPVVSSDSPDYSSSPAQAQNYAQNVRLNPKGMQRIVP